MASFDDWLDAYEVVYGALPAESDHQCPNCGHRTLRMVFTTSGRRVRLRLLLV
ncbi:hypothetical protein V2I01_38575 [Micromonospora sp. BRA006-A]|nr:hypothetical protein [Micromonospora sp. BRA006-A]